MKQENATDGGEVGCNSSLLVEVVVYVGDVKVTTVYSLRRCEVKDSK